MTQTPTPTSREKPRVQCAKCPWKITTNPHDIPDGYCEIKHAALKRTIAKPGQLPVLQDSLRMRACHESKDGREIPCIGWLVHQLGVGNNIGLRLAASMGRINTNVRTVGRQHARFEDTLPKGGSDEVQRGREPEADGRSPGAPDQVDPKPKDREEAHGGTRHRRGGHRGAD